MEDSLRSEEMRGFCELELMDGITYIYREFFFITLYETMVNVCVGRSGDEEKKRRNKGLWWRLREQEEAEEEEMNFLLLA